MPCVLQNVMTWAANSDESPPAPERESRGPSNPGSKFAVFPRSAGQVKHKDAGSLDATAAPLRPYCQFPAGPGLGPGPGHPGRAAAVGPADPDGRGRRRQSGLVLRVSGR